MFHNNRRILQQTMIGSETLEPKNTYTLDKQNRLSPDKKKEYSGDEESRENMTILYTAIQNSRSRENYC